METLPGHQTKCSDVLKSTQEGLAELKSKSLAAPTEFPSALSSLSPQSKMERSRQIGVMEVLAGHPTICSHVLKNK